MKAGQPLKRNTPLRRTPFVTRQELPRTGTPKVREYSRGQVKLRSSHINPVSAKRMRQNRDRAKVTAKLRDGQQWCTRCGRVAPLDAHEVLSRARGGSITDPANIVLLCRPCHSWVTENPAAAEADGWSRSAFGGAA